jgi:hypothetical protein
MENMCTQAPPSFSGLSAPAKLEDAIGPAAVAVIGISVATTRPTTPAEAIRISPAAKPRLRIYASEAGGRGLRGHGPYETDRELRTVHGTACHSPDGQRELGALGFRAFTSYQQQLNAPLVQSRYIRGMVRIEE